MRLYFHDGLKKYFLQDDNLECSVCGYQFQQMEHCLTVQKYNKKRKSQILLYCSKCDKKYKHTAEQEVVNMAVIVYELPYGCRPVVMSPISMESGKIKDCFSAADLPSEETVDKTRYAGRESWHGAQIGSMEKVKELDDAREKEVQKLISRCKNGTKNN